MVSRDDVKVRHLEHDPRCSLLIFEAIAPFRGVEVRHEVRLTQCDVTPYRQAIAGRYLGVEAGRRFAAERATKPGVLVQLAAEDPRIWDLADILPK